MENNPLELLFNPSSIAVVGVSTDVSKLGSVIYHNILDAGFSGSLFAVNPKYQEYEGQKAYPNLQSIESEIDMAVIVIPAQFVLEAVKDAAAKGVKHCVIISAGFSELGEQGQEIEAGMLQVAKTSGMRILGPNCLGLSVPSSKLDASFASQSPREGNIAFLSQSGAFNTALLDLAAPGKLGFSHFVSLGNKSDLNELDFVRAWIDDPKVEVIGMYLEEFSDGLDLVNLISSSQKPVVILNPGKSTEAKQAMSSHTGSLAGSREIITAALRKSGAIEVTSIEKMYNTLKALSWGKSMPVENLGIITNAGGPGIMVTDMAIMAGLKLPQLSEATQAELKKALPEAASTHNPVDLIGDALADRYSAALQALDKAPEVDSILAIITPQQVTQIEETAKAIINYHQSGSKPVYAVFFGMERSEPGIALLDDSKVPAFSYAEEAIFAMGKISELHKHNSVSDRLQSLNIEPSDRFREVSTDTATAISQEVLHEIAREFEFDFPQEDSIDSFQQALGFVSDHDYPVVLKASTEDIAHKTDEKALYVNISSSDELQNAFETLSQTVAKFTGKDKPKLLIQEMIKGGEELIIGVTRDGDSKVYQPEGKGFGHLLVFGKGGIHTEVYKDVAGELVPVSESDIKAMVNRTKISQVISGVRGQKPLAMGKLIETINATQKLVLKYPEIEQVDINPVILTEDRCVVVDMKVFVRK